MRRPRARPRRRSRRPSRRCRLRAASCCRANPSCTWLARSMRACLVALQRIGGIGHGHAFEVTCQHDGIFDRHAGALRHEGQHRMRRVAQQRHAALGPGGHRIALVQRGLEHGVAGIEQGARLGVVGDVLLAQFVDAAGRGPRFEMPAVLRRGREDEDVLAAIEREGHDLALRIRAPPLGEGAEVRHAGDTLGRHHGAVGHDAGEARALGAEHRGAHGRVDTVGADQHADARAAAVLEVAALTPSLVRRNGLGPLAQRDALGREHVRQRGQQVGTVDGELRRTVALFGRVGHFEARGFLAGVVGAADAVRWAAPPSRGPLRRRPGRRVRARRSASG